MSIKIEFKETDIIGGKYLENTGRNGKIEVNPLGKEYFYKLFPGMEKPRLGDMVVVSSQNGFGVILVTTLNATSHFKDMAYCVGSVSPESYVTYLENEKRKGELRNALEKKKKELEEIVTWELLAEKSPEFKALLDEYKELV